MLIFGAADGYCQSEKVRRNEKEREKKDKRRILIISLTSGAG